MTQLFRNFVRKTMRLVEGRFRNIELNPSKATITQD